MSAVRAYLLRIVICAFLVSLAGAVPMQKSVKRAVTLCGGCLIIIVVLRPLLGADFSAVTERWMLPRWSTEEPSDPEEVYSQLLRKLITEQTQSLLQERAEAMGIQVSFRVELAEDPVSGQPVPWTVETVGALTSEQRKALSAYMSGSLNVPAERQRWSIS